MSKTSSRLGRGLGSLIAGGTQGKTETTSVPISNLDDQERLGSSNSATTSNKTETTELGKGAENLFEIPTDSLVPNPLQ